MHILINTGGGDAPGLNAVIRAVTLAALRRGWRVSGIRRGYHGLLDAWPDGVIPLDAGSVRGITHLGGTILGTINRGHPFEYPRRRADGGWAIEDRSDLVVERFHATGAEALVAIGGDGSLRIAQRFVDKGLPVIGVPKTIDNDLSCTQATFGFDSAVQFATESLDRLHATAEAHNRVFVVEVMGRYAGWIALQAGLAGTADVILLPEIPFDLERVCAKIASRYQDGIGFAIVVVAEGAMPADGRLVVREHAVGREVRLGGIAEQVADAIAERQQVETRSLVLGHLQRGGSPTAQDRTLALTYGSAAVRLIEQGRFGHMVAWQPPRMQAVPIAEAVASMKAVPVDGDLLAAARDLGVCLGDS